MNKIWIGALMIAGGVILSACSSNETDEPKEEGEKLKLNVVVQAVDQRDFSHWVDLQGTVIADKNIMLSSEASGKIQKIYVKEGEQVRKGKLIASIDSEIIAKNIAEVENSLELAEYMFEKQKSLMKKGVGTEVEYRQAENQVKALKKSLETLRTQSSKSVVFAPFNGVIEEIFPVEGELGGPQVPICHIIGLKDLTVNAEISEAYVQTIGEGTRVNIKIPALDTVISGLSITRSSKFIDPKNRTFKIHIELENDNKDILPNLIARVQARTKLYKNALVVSNQAIQYNKGGETYLFKLSQNEDGLLVANQVMIQQLASYGQYTAFKSAGIQKGDRIVLKGAEGIDDGDQVEIKED